MIQWVRGGTHVEVPGHPWKASKSKQQLIKPDIKIATGFWQPFKSGQYILDDDGNVHSKYIYGLVTNKLWYIWQHTQIISIQKYFILN